MLQIQKQNVTVSLSTQTLKKAKILAAKRSTSISRLLAEQIDALVREDDAYEIAQRRALALLEKGFHMGGGPMVSREELHDRENLR
jgi:hypothetical protein